MTLTVTAAVASRLNTGLLAGVTIQNGSSASLEPVLWPEFQSATRDTVLLQPLHPLRIMGEGTVRLQYIGELYENQCSTCKGLQFGHDTHSRSECFSWKTAWFIVGRCHSCIDFRGSGHVISKPAKPPDIHWTCGILIQFLFSRGAHMNVDSNWGTSLNLDAYSGYPVLNIARTHSWLSIIVVYLLQYCLQADAILLLSSWLHVSRLQLFPGLSWTVQGYINSSSSAFLASLNGRAEAQQHNTCSVGSICVCSGIVTITFWPHFKLGVLPTLLCRDLSFWRYSSVDPMILKSGHVIQCGLELVQWKIAWLIDLDYISVNNKLRLPVQWDPSLQRSVELIQRWMMSFSLVELQAWPSRGLLLLVRIVQRVASDNCDEIIMLAKVIGEEASIFLYCGRLHEKQLCWLPWQYSSCTESMSESFPWYIAWLQVSSGAGSDLDGSGTLSQEVIMGSRHLGSLCYFKFCTQAEAKGRSVAAPDYCHCLDHGYFFDKVCADQDNYLDVFHDQVHIGNDYYLGVFLEQVVALCYINLVKVWLDYDAHRDLGEVMKHQVPWDPGGSSRHRLEDKPKFKEGGMLATFPTLPWAGPWADIIGPGLLGSDMSHSYKY